MCRKTKSKKLWKSIGMFTLMTMLLSGCNSATKANIEEFHDPLFGENTYIFTPEDNPEQVQEALDKIYKIQESNQFGTQRYSVLFMPGEYDDSIEVNMGFYTQVAGLGITPDDTKIETFTCLARWLSDDPSNNNATCNFWRSVENLNVGSNTTWAVSQATSMRRMHIEGNLYLHDENGWSSGGFLSDSVVDGIVDSGSQQQWLSRNCEWKMWLGENWNMVFAGIADNNAPEGTWPAKKYTNVEKVEEMQDKPFLTYDEEKGYGVFVPESRTNSSGISWKDEVKGTFVEIKDFYIANPDEDTAQTMNEALADGKHLLLTPGIYSLDEPLVVENEDTIVMGMGYATLAADNDGMCMKVADKSGIKICGILFDAGEKSESLLQVGYDVAEGENASEETVDSTGEKSASETVGDSAGEKSASETTGDSAGEKEVPILLSDLFFRVGGAAAHKTEVENCVVIDSSHVLGDNFWVWRADHGEQVAWDTNLAKNGIIINGDYVSMYALMVEHFQEYQTIWNGNYGKTIFYQCEIPYDVPDQESWMSHDGTVNGFASYHVAENVTDHEAWGLGIYSFHRDAVVDLHTAMEVPVSENVKVHNICTVMITGNPGISHIINDCGNSVMTGGKREIICEFANGEIQ